MDRTELYRLVDQLPKPLLATAARILEVLRDTGDPVRQAADNAAPEDEVVSPEEEAAVGEAHRDLERGDVLSDSDFWAAVDAEEG